MTNLKTIQEIIPRVRVVNSTYIPSDEKKALIGKELGVAVIFYSEKTISVFNEDKFRWWLFNLSDVRFLCPPEFKIGERTIAIGDVLERYGKKYEVYGYSWYDGRWVVDVAKNFDYKDTIYFDTTDLPGLTFSTQEDEVAKALKLLEDRGIIKAGKVISN